MEHHFLPDKSQIPGERNWILLSEIEKKESKTVKTFQKLLEQISESHQYNHSRQSWSSRGNIYDMKKRTKN